MTDQETRVTGRKNKAFRFFVSQAFIDIAADAIALQTKKTCRFSTLRSAIEIGCERLAGSHLDAEDFLAFQQTTQLGGDIRVHLNMHASWSAAYDELKAQLSKIVAKRVFDRTAIAYLLHLSIQNDLY